jgi:hypothetical protein
MCYIDGQKNKYSVLLFRNKKMLYIDYLVLYKALGARGRLVVKALGYKSEGRGFETWWGDILNLLNPSGRANPWGLLSLVTEMSTGNIKKNVSEE